MINKCLYNKNVANFGLSHILIISWQQSGGKISKNVDFPGGASGKELVEKVSFQPIPKNSQTTAQLHSSHTLVK